jgi:hypothetical protein
VSLCGEILVKEPSFVDHNVLFISTFAPISFPGCRCPEQYTGSHCELLKTERHKYGPPLAKDTDSAGILFVLVVLAILLVALTSVIVFRLRGKNRYRYNIETAYIEEEAEKSSMMEEVDFEDDGVMEDIELL